MLAAVLAAGAGAVGLAPTAMALHGIEPARRVAPTPIEVSIPAERDATVVAASIVHRVLLPPSDVTVVDGIPCTTYERTLRRQRGARSVSASSPVASTRVW